MNPDRLGLGVQQHALEAFVAPVARLLVTAPRQSHVAMVEAVDPNHARLDIPRRPVGGVEIAGPDASVIACPYAASTLLET